MQMNTDLIHVTSRQNDNYSMRILVDSFPQLNWDYEYNPYDRWVSVEDRAKYMNQFIGKDKESNILFRARYNTYMGIWTFEPTNSHPGENSFSLHDFYGFNFTGYGSSPKEAYEEMQLKIKERNDNLYKYDADLYGPCVLILFPLIASLISSL
jgi:hypothetical protein